MRYAVFVKRMGQITYFTTVIGQQAARELAQKCVTSGCTGCAWTVASVQAIAELPAVIEGGGWTDCFTR